MGLSEEDEGWQRAGDAVTHTRVPLKWCWYHSRCREPACVSTDLTTRRRCNRICGSLHHDVSSLETNMEHHSICIYIYTWSFGRYFYPKQIVLHLKVHILSVHTFPENQTRDLGIASAMCYSLSYSCPNLQ